MHDRSGSERDRAPRARRFRRWSGNPLFLVLLFAVGAGLIFAGQILAGQAEDHPQPGHDESADHGEAVHGGEHGEDGIAAAEHEEGVSHPPNLVGILAGLIEGKAVHTPEDAKNPVARNLVLFTPFFFSLLVTGILAWIATRATRNMTLVPGGLQNFVEWVVESLDGFVRGVIGPEGGRFVPFVGTLFLYIYCMNVMGLFPLGFGSTSMLETTAALAICVFLYVQWVGIRSNGVLGYVKHLAGDPKSPVEWGMVPLILPLHVVGEIAKPISLSLRLFGNILGGETLLAVFMGLGVGMIAVNAVPFGVPLQVPFIFLELLVTFIQALVFTVLAAIYFALVLPHEEHH